METTILLNSLFVVTKGAEHCLIDGDKIVCCAHVYGNSKSFFIQSGYKNYLAINAFRVFVGLDILSSAKIEMLPHEHNIESYIHYMFLSRLEDMGFSV